MGVFEASLEPAGPIVDAIRDIRGICPLPISISEIRGRLTSGDPLFYWDTDQYPVDIDRVDYHRQIRAQIQTLVDRGHCLRFLYRPARGDRAEVITLEQLDNLFESELIDEQQEYE